MQLGRRVKAPRKCSALIFANLANQTYTVTPPALEAISFWICWGTASNLASCMVYCARPLDIPRRLLTYWNISARGTSASTTWKHNGNFRRLQSHHGMLNKKRHFNHRQRLLSKKSHRIGYGSKSIKGCEATEGDSTTLNKSRSRYTFADMTRVV